MRLELLADEHDLAAAGQATYGMSNLRNESTGLPSVIFISQKDDARHAARVKWSPQPKVKRDLLGFTRSSISQVHVSTARTKVH